jgi:hypothetical protein
LVGGSASEAFRQQNSLVLRLCDQPEVGVRVLASQISLDIEQARDCKGQAAGENYHRQQSNDPCLLILQAKLHD